MAFLRGAGEGAQVPTLVMGTMALASQESAGGSFITAGTVLVCTLSLLFQKRHSS